MSCWAASRSQRDRERNHISHFLKTLETAVQRRARREPLPLLVLALGNTVEGLEGRAIYCESFFIEIDLNRTLGMDSNCIIVALFRLFFFFFL